MLPAVLMLGRIQLSSAERDYSYVIIGHEWMHEHCILSTCLSLSKLLAPKSGSDCHPCIAIVCMYLFISIQSEPC